MKILYLSKMNLFSERAHVYTVTRTCEAMNEARDSELTLLVTDSAARTPTERERYFKFHNVTHPFAIAAAGKCAEKLKHSKSPFLYNVSNLLTNFSFGWYVAAHRNHFDILYYRDHFLIVPVLLARLFGKKTIFEAHYVLENKSSQWIADRMAGLSSGVVAISGSLKDYYLKLNPHVLLSFCAAAEPDRFASVKSPAGELRKKLDLPLEKTILMYTGNIGKTGIGDSYGVEDIVAALPKLSDDIVFVAIGKKPGAITEPEKMADRLKLGKRVIFIGWKDRNEIAEYIAAADILIIPRSGARAGNSPTKMFEYLASGKPIVAARTEPIEEVLEDGKTALLVDYAHPDAWVEAVKLLKADEDLSLRLVHEAKLEGTKYTWAARGVEIAGFVGSL